MNRTTLVTALIAVTAELALIQPVAAVTQSRQQAHTGANMCTLSIPTTDTKVRPKATGFRNEGTTDAFVICAFETPPGGASVVTDFMLAGIVMKSLDGADHEVTCTAVNSLPDGTVIGIPPQQYVSKTVTVNDTSPNGVYGTPVIWAPEDFGAAPDTTIPSSAGLFSITCNLPPQVSIKVGAAITEEDVGN